MTVGPGLRKGKCVPEGFYGCTLHVLGGEMATEPQCSRDSRIRREPESSLLSPTEANFGPEAPPLHKEGHLCRTVWKRPRGKERRKEASIIDQGISAARKARAVQGQLSSQNQRPCSGEVRSSRGGAKAQAGRHWSPGSPYDQSVQARPSGPAHRERGPQPRSAQQVRPERGSGWSRGRGWRPGTQGSPGPGPRPRPRRPAARPSVPRAQPPPDAAVPATRPCRRSHFLRRGFGHLGIGGRERPSGSGEAADTWPRRASPGPRCPFIGETRAQNAASQAPFPCLSLRVCFPSLSVAQKSLLAFLVSQPGESWGPGRGGNRNSASLAPDLLLGECTCSNSHAGQKRLKVLMK